MLLSSCRSREANVILKKAFQKSLRGHRDRNNEKSHKTMNFHGFSMVCVSFGAISAQKMSQRSQFF